MTLELERRLSLQDLPVLRKGLLIVLATLLILSDLLPSVGLESSELSFGIEVVLGVTFLTFAMRDRLDRRQRVSLRNNLIVLTVAIAVATAGAEAATRWVFRDVTTSADSGSFFSRRWINDVAFNQSGFRERDFPLEKPPNTYRVAVIGDSFTFGNGLPPEQRYTDLMNAWLPDRFEVLNFAIPGNNTPQHLQTLRSRVLPAKPDFVLLQWFVNDIEGEDLSQRPRPALLAPHPALHRWLNRHSALYVIANLRWAEIQIALGWYPSYAEYLKMRAGDPDSGDSRREARQLGDIITTARQHNIDFGIVLFPDTGGPLDETYAFQFLHERVLEICRKAGVHCLDLRRDFAIVKDRRALWVSPFDHHPSARANEMAAVRILETFERDWQK
jgi:hypothetical protein